METKELENWALLPAAIKEIRQDFGHREVDLPDGTSHSVPVDIVFRGQGDADWELQSTLERSSNREFSVASYLERATSVQNSIESVSSRLWNLPSLPEIRREIENDSDSMRVHLPCYPYLVYLRHLGFPSPFIDWSFSPYVAAYFAMESARSERAAIFAFIERPGGAKQKIVGEPQINCHGPYVTTHVRHVAQKAVYTTATRWSSDRNQHNFCSHSVGANWKGNYQDVLIKITLPASDRLLSLRELEDFNINHYTLFQSEDSLVRWQGLRAFELEF